MPWWTETGTNGNKQNGNSYSEKAVFTCFSVTKEKRKKNKREK